MNYIIGQHHSEVLYGSERRMHVYCADVSFSLLLVLLHLSHILFQIFRRFELIFNQDSVDYSVNISVVYSVVLQCRLLTYVFLVFFLA